MAFNILKKVFISDVIFYYYNPDYKIVIETDASDYMSEGILSQYNEDEVFHLIVYFSKKHNSAECNYKIYDKKLMAIVHTFEEWHSELEGFISSVKVITDHKNLEYFMFIKQLSHHQATLSALIWSNYAVFLLKPPRPLFAGEDTRAAARGKGAIKI